MMIDLDYIQHLAENHEGVDVEFKETTGQLNRGMETLCGMINGSGGIVVFGVSNKGKIIGQAIRQPVRLGKPSISLIRRLTFNRNM